MDQLAAFRETVELAKKRGMEHLRLAHESLDYDHLVDMLRIVEEEDFSEGKLGRWLGWAQAAVVAAGIATLEEMKAINVKHSGKEALPLDPEPWANDFGNKYPHNHPNVLYTNLVWAPDEGHEQNRANYPERIRSMKPLPLDPYPWATTTGTRGSKWMEKYDHILTFAPREGYEQNRANYPEGVR